MVNMETIKYVIDYLERLDARGHTIRDAIQVFERELEAYRSRFNNQRRYRQIAYDHIPDILRHKGDWMTYTEIMKELYKINGFTKYIDQGQFKIIVCALQRRYPIETSGEGIDRAYRLKE